MQRLEIVLNAFLILILSVVLSGAFAVQLFLHEAPCVLCFIQRMAMVGVGMGALFNILFGIKPSHYGLSLIAAVSGLMVALRQIALHVCPGTLPYGEPVFGLSLYVWSFLVFLASILYIAALLFMYVPFKEEAAQKTPFMRLTTLFFALVVCGNILSGAFVCGWGLCD